MIRVAVIDVDSVCYTIGNGNKVRDEYGVPIRQDNKFVYVDKTEDELAKCADETMSIILKNCSCDAYIGFIKGKDTTKSRVTINPEYKANRSHVPPQWWEFVKEYLISSWGVIEVNNLEVDDAVNITRLTIPDSFIVAIDGDLLGLQGTHFKWRLKDSLNGEWITVTKDQAVHKFWKDMIVGQVGDNIKGLPGKGEKFWKDHLSMTHLNDLPSEVLKAYSHYLTEHKGIMEFYKNYISLKTLESHGEFTIPEPIIVPEHIKKVFNPEDLFK